MKQYQFMKDVDENGEQTVNVAFKPRRRFNLVASLVCLLGAIAIWLAVVNINETDVTETMVLKITYEGVEELEERNMMIYGMDKTEVTVTVQGTNRDIKKHAVEDYSVVVDVSDLITTGSYILPLEIKIPDDSKVTVAPDSSLNVSLFCDVAAEKTVPFDVLVSTVQDITFESVQSHGEIVIRGPQRVLNDIESARFNADGNFAPKEDAKVYTDFPLVFLDKNFNEVEDGQAVEYSTEGMSVTVSAIARKRIPVIVEVEGVGKDLSYELSTDFIEISGAPSVINTVVSYDIRFKNVTEGKQQHKVTNIWKDHGVTIKEESVITITFEKNTSENE